MDPNAQLQEKKFPTLEQQYTQSEAKKNTQLSMNDSALQCHGS